MSTSLEKRNFQTTDMIQDDQQQSTKRVKFSGDSLVNDSSLYESGEQQYGEETSSAHHQQQGYENEHPINGSILEETNESGNHSFEIQQGSSVSGTSSSTEYMDPNMQNARQRLSEIHEKMEGVLNNFTMKLSELVNQCMGRVQETAIDRTNDLKKMMDEVDEMYKRNLEANSQLEKTKELTHQFTLDA